MTGESFGWRPIPGCQCGECPPAPDRAAGLRVTPEELDAIRERDAHAKTPARTWAVEDRRRLLATLDATGLDGRNAILDEVMEVVGGVPTLGEERLLLYRSQVLNALVGLRVIAASPETTGLDAAWAEVEAALPEGWDFGIAMYEGGYRASAAPLTSSFAYREGKYADGDTPTTALLALAARFRETGGWREASRELHVNGDDEPYATDDPS